MPNIGTEQLARILIVDDEQLIAELTHINLKAEGFEVDVCNSAEECIEKDMTVYDLIILDIMMGAISGITLARRLKQSPSTADIPIIFCSARGDEEDIVTGLGLGAADYIAKPFSMRELVARVKAVLNRRLIGKDKMHSAELGHGNLVLKYDTSQIFVNGECIALTHIESELLALFLGNKNRLFSRAEIFNLVWPERVVVCDRTIDVNISRLRKKLGVYASHLVNRSGFGYGFKE